MTKLALFEDLGYLFICTADIKFLSQLYIIEIGFKGILHCLNIQAIQNWTTETVV